MKFQYGTSWTVKEIKTKERQSGVNANLTSNHQTNQTTLKQTKLHRKSKKFVLINKIIENSCSSYLNSQYHNTTWNCKVFDGHDEKQSQEQKQKDACICSLTYDCYDYEEFSLESELVGLDYMSKENYLGSNFYTHECEKNLLDITNESWNCTLQYDRMHLDDFYCHCKRPKKCQIQKLLYLKDIQ